MTKLTEYTSYADAQKHWSPDKLWELFDGNREQLNIAHECIDRHVDGDRTAVILAHADGRDEKLILRARSRANRRSSRTTSPRRACAAGDRVAVMLEPSRAFYVAIFGAIKLGAIAVPLFTLFGPDGIRLRVQDCTPKTARHQRREGADGRRHPRARRSWSPTRSSWTPLASYPDSFKPTTRGDDYAIYQYTSGTTRELPEAVKHTHRSIVTLMLAALYGTGLRPGDRFFCPSSPAWGHGLWHGTLAPLALGLTIGAFSGKFNAERLLKALHDHRVHQPVGGGDALPDDAQLRRGAEVRVLPRQALVHRRADRQRDRRVRRGRRSAIRSAACTAPPRSA